MSHEGDGLYSHEEEGTIGDWYPVVERYNVTIIIYNLMRHKVELPNNGYTENSNDIQVSYFKLYSDYYNIFSLLTKKMWLTTLVN